ncbi:CotH kinase family protein [Peribacillus simplex]|uniref:CotH kinase family protein n=1 Tax=Peribacillus simplex TaxID=1478 RepID=UPI003B9DCE06
MKPIIQEMHDQIRPYVPKDPYIKGGKEKFDNEPEFILKFIEARAKYIIAGRLNWINNFL